MLLLSKEDIKSVITMKDMIEADKQAFKMVVDGTVDTIFSLIFPIYFLINTSHKTVLFTRFPTLWQYSKFFISLYN